MKELDQWFQQLLIYFAVEESNTFEVFDVEDGLLLRLGMDHVFELLRLIQDIPIDQLMGRRDFPLNRWDPISYLDRIRLMYDSVLYVLGEQRWRHLQMFFEEDLSRGLTVLSPTLGSEVSPT